MSEGDALSGCDEATIGEINYALHHGSRCLRDGPCSVCVVALDHGFPCKRYSLMPACCTSCYSSVCLDKVFEWPSLNAQIGTGGRPAFCRCVRLSLCRLQGLCPLELPESRSCETISGGAGGIVVELALGKHVFSRLEVTPRSVLVYPFTHIYIVLG